MAQTLPTNINPVSPPANQTRAQADLLAHYRNALETTAAGGFSICDRRAPDGDDRRALMVRRDELSTAMGGSNPHDVVKRVARLFMRFPSTRFPDGMAEATTAAYAADLACFPLWAIDEACLAVIGGRTDTSKAFAPSSIEMREACHKAMDPIRAEFADLRNVLSADIYHEPTPEERAKVAAEFQALVQELKLNMDPRDNAKPSRPLTRHEAEAALERAKINPVRAPAFSDGLRQHLGLPEREKGEAA